MNGRQSHIILRPIINEKTVTLAANLKQYTFEVARDANKTEIAQALEQILGELYPKSNSKVKKVNTAPIRERFRRSKRHGRAPIDGKKAIVTIEGEPLELFSGA
jgi:large subunit ribosomal protein L23